MAEYFKKNPSASISKAAAELKISSSSVFKILRKHLELFPYKIQVHHHLTDPSIAQRYNFSGEILNKINSEGLDIKKIWFSDEAHFRLDGYVNKQNWRIWGRENPNICLARPSYSRVTVWIAFCSSMIIEPVIFTETVTSKVYLKYLSNKFLPAAKKHKKIKNYYFMQDGARPHRTRKVFNFLHRHFHDRVIALNFPKEKHCGMDWPPYSPDLNPCDYFLWGYIKDKVYSQTPKTLDELVSNIENAFNDISINALEGAIDNFLIRLRRIQTQRGEYIEQIVI